LIIGPTVIVVSCATDLKKPEATDRMHITKWLATTE